MRNSIFINPRQRRQQEADQTAARFSQPTVGRHRARAHLHANTLHRQERSFDEDTTEHHQDVVANIHRLRSPQSAELRGAPVRVRLLLVLAGGDAADPVVPAAVLHDALLHQLQHQLPALLHVRHHLPALPLAARSQEPQEHHTLPLQPSAVHLNASPPLVTCNTFLECDLFQYLSVVTGESQLVRCKSAVFDLPLL
ncbi:uncharacterized protein LOC126095468 [Schistocerca cancellata]|uniref:uncharacterized protein LOC126095468 n=1 Tax=Schistocerca cancellata TaxID=274614 RepID=UPI0021198D37|nr:uncharacterized protein LOC126095468 [Schistocerca cancellata]